MSRSVLPKKARQNIEAQFALVERALKNVHKSIDEQLERAQDLEVERALALYKCGKATMHDGKDIIEQARRLVG